MVGAGAAGLMAAIWAGRGGRCDTILLDGARRPGAKILVAGGGRCNVTHDVVTEADYAGSSRRAIRKVLLRFDVPRTVAFFAELGVTLKREETGKLFPTTDDARTVLDALLRAARAASVRLEHPWKVASIRRAEGGFELASVDGRSLRAERVVLAAGGQSLPKSGSDGSGYGLARSLGHSVTPHLLPALVGLTLADGCFVRGLSGLTLPATVEVRGSNGRRIASFTDSTLCTHFGISGPAAMDASRWWQEARLADAGTKLVVSWIPGATVESLDLELRDLRGQTPVRFLAPRLPERLARALCETAGVDPAAPGHELPRELRRALATAIAASELPVTGTRGWNLAEATAGGVPLSELHLDTMESRLCPGLHLCGEILDVDGRIGGYNFQWAWASGYVAGISAGL